MEACENHVAFSELENKTRKRWLFWSVLLPGFISAGFLILMLFASALSGDFISKGIGITLFWVLLSGGGLYIGYHCAYKKAGTILLLLQMIGICLNLIAALFNVKSFFVMKEPLFTFVGLAIVLSYDIVVFYYSFKLRRINKGYRERSGHFDSAHD